MVDVMRLLGENGWFQLMSKVFSTSRVSFQVHRAEDQNRNREKRLENQSNPVSVSVCVIRPVITVCVMRSV